MSKFNGTFSYRRMAKIVQREYTTLEAQLRDEWLSKNTPTKCPDMYISEDGIEKYQ